jgi:hypothetical protein
MNTPGALASSLALCLFLLAGSNDPEVFPDVPEFPDYSCQISLHSHLARVVTKAQLM